MADIVAAFLPAKERGGRLGVPEAAKTVTAAALAARSTGPTLLLAPTPARSQALAEELALYLEDVPLARLPERERLPYEFSRDNPVVTVERARALAVMRGPDRGLCVASWAALSEYTAGPEVDAEGVAVTVGGALGPAELMRALEEGGYEVTRLAERPGTVSRRGGIIDVFPAGRDESYRVEFFGNEVESIRLVDVASQRSVRRLERIELPPASTGTRQAREAAALLLERITAEGEDAETVVEQLELIAGGGRSDYEGFFEPLLYRTTALAHLAPNGALLFDDAEDGGMALGRLCEQQARTQGELEERGVIPTGLPTLNAGARELKAELDARPGALHLERFGSEELGARRLPMRATPAFGGKLKPFSLQCAQWAREGESVVVVSQQALRLAELMEEDGVAVRLRRQLGERPAAGSVTVVPLALGGGFTLDDRLVVVSDAEVFGFRKRRRPTRGRQGVRPDLVSSLEPGDYLVHVDHGIARYGGLVRRTVDGIEREYLELQYAEGDRLYAPADQLDAVTRYVGPTDHPPALTRLGSQDWARAKRRVRQAILEMAQELLELYARREMAEGHAFGPDGAWQMEMEAAFPFVETPEQLEAIAEVKADMERTRPMDRLICGDVGYGKTEVAVRAAFKAVADGRQVAVLVPTTVLAEQHGHTFRERVAGFPVRVEVLSRFRSDHEQRAIVAALKAGDVDIVIGTHRLLQRDVEFKDLGLVVIDEEQRFGVTHKERLRQMRAEVDTLTLSATPIPRTLQMSLTGIRDMSTIMTPPEERQPIRTYVMQWDDEIIREAIDRELQRGGQV
ncbi:MAG: DEAD/DEAH box helicase, partial [Dehalococcoidia bacterium]|nr:DEAD/DEAH box helicase [Dehalococcoidia bacterium]